MSRPRRVDGIPAGLGRDFNLLWAGQSGSEVGNRVTHQIVEADVLIRNPVHE